MGSIEPIYGALLITFAVVLAVLLVVIYERLMQKRHKLETITYQDLENMNSNLIEAVGKATDMVNKMDELKEKIGEMLNVLASIQAARAQQLRMGPGNGQREGANPVVEDTDWFSIPFPEPGNASPSTVSEEREPVAAPSLNPEPEVTTKKPNGLTAWRARVKAEKAKKLAALEEQKKVAQIPGVVTLDKTD